LDISDQEALFEELVSRIVEVEPKVPRDAVLKELIDREQAWPTALGHGIAVPHSYCRALTSRICAVAQIPEGVDFKAPDGEKVRLVFLLLSPQGDPEGHLATMAEIARLVGDPEVRDSLLSASSPEDLLARLRTAAPA
jgi:PTS system nitrogen regulatory IIA component